MFTRNLFGDQLQQLNLRTALCSQSCSVTEITSVIDRKGATHLLIRMQLNWIEEYFISFSNLITPRKP